MTETDSVPTTLPVRRNTFRSVAARITASHRELIERIQRIPPTEIDPRYQADAEDLEQRAMVLRCHLVAMRGYVSEYLHDTAGLSWSVHVERKWIEDCFQDIIDDCVRPIEIAAETVRQEGSWRAA